MDGLQAWSAWQQVGGRMATWLGRFCHGQSAPWGVAGAEADMGLHLHAIVAAGMGGACLQLRHPPPALLVPPHEPAGAACRPAASGVCCQRLCSLHRPSTACACLRHALPVCLPACLPPGLPPCLPSMLQMAAPGPSPTL